MKNRHSDHDHKPPVKDRVNRGLLLVNTGNGKGKSTAAFGVMLRAWGRGLKVVVIQFIKHNKAMFGEQLAAKRLGIEMIPYGRGFTWNSKDLSEDEALARNGWEMCKEKIHSNEYDVVIMDEITYPIKYGWIEIDEVVKNLGKRPKKVNIIITGRDAHDDLIKISDCVTRMEEIKHPYTDQGILAQKGIDY